MSQPSPLPVTETGSKGTTTWEIRVRGVVQGVGFRPTVWRLARDAQLVGSVMNDGAGVLIRATGSTRALSRFVSCLEQQAPPLSRIETLTTRPVFETDPPVEFRILESPAGENRTRVTPDASICLACVAETNDSKQRRFDYPFTNCTHCGPRFSIIQSFPYDRSRTTMSTFSMCVDCSREYADPADRRFHAQPIACPACGPRVWLEQNEQPRQPGSPNEDEDPIQRASRLLNDGAIVAVRGLGGFHLCCDATNDEAVTRLRHRKRRFGKPFALMARSTKVIERYCDLSTAEQELLESVAAPIVLLKPHGREALPVSLAPGSGRLGFMLPYTPLHLLLSRSFDRPLVMTSGNTSDRPQVIAIGEARQRLGPIADAMLMHDREIANRIDDSVTHVFRGRPRMIRRARGYAPSITPISPDFRSAPDLLAFGAELKSTFCLLKDGAAVLSQHQGDLEDLDTFDDYERNLRLYKEMYDHDPKWLVCDKHPEYLSSKLARQIAHREGLPLLEVQHHHAHVASCMAENDLPIDSPPVLGVALDGLGFGDDGTIWGGEFLLADYRSFRRLGSLKPTAMIGGSQAIREPWRSTYAQLSAWIGWEAFVARYASLELCKMLQQRDLAIVERMRANAINAPLASSCGRLFDAVAAALGVCADGVTFEGQGAVELEKLAEDWVLGGSGSVVPYTFSITPGDARSPRQLDPGPMWRGLLDDLASGEPVGRIAARFHQGLGAAICQMISQILATPELSQACGIVALTGGCFQNKILLECVTDRLEAKGYRCLVHSQVPSNDGGLALGQAAIAAAQLVSGDITAQR